VMPVSLCYLSLSFVIYVATRAPAGLSCPTRQVSIEETPSNSPPGALPGGILTPTRCAQSTSDGANAAWSAPGSSVSRGSVHYLHRSLPRVVRS
jgi:hypothetical protein